MENITTVPSGNYEGYIWESDKSQPLVLDNKRMDVLDLSIIKNPFIIEAQLFNGSTGDSYSVRFIDNAYHVTHANINTLDGKKQEYAFIANFHEAPGMLKFIQYWRAEDDPLCKGMQVLTPKDFIFVGFEK